MAKPLTLPDGTPVPTWATALPTVQEYRDLRAAVGVLVTLNPSPDTRATAEATLASLGDAARIAIANENQKRTPSPQAERHLTFEQLLQMEPRLRDLRQFVWNRSQQCGPRRKWCANSAWYGYGQFDGTASPKARLVDLIGWHRPPDPANPNDAVLRSEKAYVVAYNALYDLLPNCRKCGCL